MTLGTSIYRLELIADGPTMQITMGKWDKQGQKEAQNQ